MHRQFRTSEAFPSAALQAWRLGPEGGQHANRTQSQAQRHAGPNATVTTDNDIVFLFDYDNTLLDPYNLSAYPPAEVAIERIGDLLDYDLSTLVAADGHS